MRDIERTRRRLASAKMVLGLVRQSQKTLDGHKDKTTAAFLERKVKVDSQQIKFALHVEKLEAQLSAQIADAKRASADAARERAAKREGEEGDV